MLPGGTWRLPCSLNNTSVDSRSFRFFRKFTFSAPDYENPMGYFNGLIVNAEGEEMPIHNIWGTSEKLYLRV